MNIKWIKYLGIKPGAHVDVKDCEGDWFEAKILTVTDQVAKCHFINYSRKWDCNIVLSPDNVAAKNTHTKSLGNIKFYALFFLKSLFLSSIYI